MTPRPPGIPLHPDWHHQAACRGMNPDLFFPGPYEPNTQAIATCTTCPVQPQCDQAGTNEHFGIWGGKPRGTRRPGTHNHYTRLTHNPNARNGANP